ncbi:hypothetical protein [Streptomyces caeruleatus]|uniref:Uncharacterized protein n=1 Tax=Streptomyces caeruleatus TaxID=661399 RepID=A0A101TUU4_9ACTN|nr:hypothetical protein [Streptomyces caeruleatus]KUN98989.1 hypothetical protein AQJ67_26855 [Streptomyces caeruleatus]
MNQTPAGDGQGSGTYVGGSVTGNGIAVGAGASAAYTSTTAPADASHQALLQAVRDLSEDLRRYPVTPETQELSASLEETEQQVTSTGRAQPGVLSRLRTALEEAGGLLGAITSATALGTAVAGLIGG